MTMSLVPSFIHPSTSIVTHFFRSRAVLSETTQEPLPPTVIQTIQDGLPIRLILVKLIGRRRWIDPSSYAIYDEPNLVAERGITVPLSRLKASHRIRCRYRKVMAENLSRMGVPEAEQPDIIGKIFQVVDDSDVAVPFPGGVLPIITMKIEQVTMSVLSMDFGSIKRFRFDYMRTFLGLSDSVATQSSIAALATVRLGSATQSPVAALETVRLGRLGDIMMVIMANNPCPICYRDLDQHPPRSHWRPLLRTITITRMPCYHFFHKACILRWLKKSCLCPVCDYIMPREYVGGWLPLTIFFGCLITSATLVRKFLLCSMGNK